MNSRRIIASGEKDEEEEEEEKRRKYKKWKREILEAAVDWFELTQGGVLSSTGTMGRPYCVHLLAWSVCG